MIIVAFQKHYNHTSKALLTRYKRKTIAFQTHRNKKLMTLLGKSIEDILSNRKNVVSLHR